MTAQTSTQHPTIDRLVVPGAQLHYEVRGSGPLLLVVGQPMASPAFAPVADLLAQDHTVVTYDPHGLGQSTLDDPSLDVTPEIEADELALLIDAVGGGPADVFATSGGAVAGLGLVVRHPEHVRTLVAHEPPVCELLPDAVQVRAAVDQVADAYRSGGSGAAWGGFISLVVYPGLVTDAGVPPVSWPPPGQEHSDNPEPPPPPSAKARADDELFFLRMLKPFTRYVPEVDAIRAGKPRVVVAVGAASGEQIAPRSSRALADQLGQEPVLLPGDHGGFMSDPEGFARALRELVSRTDR